MMSNNFIVRSKYQAETLRIFGLAFLTPLARLLLDPLAFLKEYHGVAWIIYGLLSVICAILGLIIITRGLEIIE